MQNQERKLSDEFHWDESCMHEVTLPDPDSFLKIKETLSRIGVPSRDGKTLYQSCHILHRRGKYYIMFFKELFSLDGKPTYIEFNDIARRNTIAQLLQEWGLCTILFPSDLLVSSTSLKIIPFSKKKDWILVTKYTVGKK